MHPRSLAAAPVVLLLAAAALGSAPSASAAGTSRPTGRLLVTVTGDAPSAASRATSALRSAGSGARPTETLGATVAVPVPGAATRRRVAARLTRDDRVAQVVDEQRAVSRALPSDPVLRDQDPLAPPPTTLAWWADRMRLPQAWRLSEGRGTTVAVIDSGFDLTHPQLAPVVDRALTSQVAGIPGTARTDEYGHGTHVASLACSAFDDGAGTVGAGGRCRLVTIKSDLYDLSVARAVRRATGLGVDAIVMSFGTDGSRPASRALRDALVAADDAGVVLVAAAADVPTTEQGWPANVLQPTGTGADPDAGIGLTVTAATAAGSRATFAGSGSQISLAAYGTYADSGGPPGILGAFPAGTVANEQARPGDEAPATRTTVRGDGRYAYQAGTSMATPMVAGVAALMRGANPDLGSTAITRLLKRTARRGSGWTEGLGWGVVDAQAAVDAARRVDLRAPTATFSTTPQELRTPTLELAWRGTDRSPSPLVPSGLRTVELWRSVDGGRFGLVGRARRGMAVEVPRGTVRYALRAVDKAGNRARLPTKRSLVVTRR
ncbi:S8 family serine peptidase [Patulibacter sp.]|uniref:S8 family peptidase n=1 Tax=Patulibacter sp. TaxID=1912859 RepID=UPI0027235F28|nr:S8 family serine peptidase [Patulibacter sp.]MDO9407555.1 S8 family serine peptidase [Patulibacter sp.]